LIISEILHNEFSLVSNVIDIREFNKKSDLSQFSLIILGSGIRMGRWYGKALKMLKFLEKNHSKNNKFAIFVSSGRAGHAIVEQNQDNYSLCFERYIEQKLSNFPNLTPIISEKAFGGRKFKNNQISDDTWNKEDIQEWAREIGNLIK